MRTLTTAAKNAFAQLNFPAILFVEMDIESGFVRLVNTAYSFDWNGHTWTGVGTLGSIEAVAEGTVLQMYGCALTMSGVPSETIAMVLNENYQGRNVTIWLAPLTADYTLIADPVVVFKGRMDTMDIAMGATSTVTVACESRLVDWERPRIRRFNDQDQQAIHPGDRGLMYVDQMVNKDLPWGRPNDNVWG